MKRVILECKGRLANQILCWANAVHVLDKLGLEDWVIVVNYPDLASACFPEGTEVACLAPFDTAKMRRVTRKDLASQNCDCLWVWEDIYSNFPNVATMTRIIRDIGFPVEWSHRCFNKWVGIHVRFGDYIAIDTANPPVPMPPFPRATEGYYLNAIAICRELEPGCRFFVASDGTDKELSWLTTGRGIIRNVEDDALFDLYCLSKCRLIIGSASTFTSVAAAYGGVPVVLPSMSPTAIRAIISKTAHDLRISTDVSNPS